MALTESVDEIVENSSNPLLGKHDSWERVRLGEIAEIQNGFAFKSTQFSKESGIPLIRIRDVVKDDTETFYTGEYDPVYMVQPGDLLIGMDGDFNCARWCGSPGLLNQRVCRIKLKSDVLHPKLIDYALPGYLKAINDKTSSVTVKHLSSKTVSQIPLPVPPPEQQELMVAEIEKQFSRLDEAVASLKRVKANLKRYKAAVLKAAVEGKLTEEWRKQNPDVEPASKLLERILAERRTKWEEAELAKMTAKGKEPKNDKWKEKYKEPAALGVEHGNALPTGWVMATVEQLAAVGTGATPLKSNRAYYEAGDIPWVTSSALNYDFIKESEDFVTELALDETNVKLFPAHSLLVAMYGEGKTRGKVSELLIDATTNQACAALVFDGLAICLKDYVKLFFQKNYDDIRRLSSGGVQPNLNLSLIKGTEIPLPPLKEQKQIVGKLDELLTVIANVYEEISRLSRRCKALRKSVLSASFAGNLIGPRM